MNQARRQAGGKGGCQEQKRKIRKTRRVVFGKGRKKVSGERVRKAEEKKQS